MIKIYSLLIIYTIADDMWYNRKCQIGDFVYDKNAICSNHPLCIFPKPDERMFRVFTDRLFLGWIRGPYP